VTLTDLDRWLRELLRFDLTDKVDASQNGLQVARRKADVQRVAVAVDASLEAIKRAAQWSADVLFVHHGILWDKPARLVGALYGRVHALVDADIALFGAHLPLDMHPDVGNNIAIARLLGIADIEPFGEYRGVKLGYKGVLPEAMSIEEVARKLTGRDATQSRIFPFGPRGIRSVGIVSGGAPYEARQAIAEGLDLYVTGEPAHGIYHDCLEGGLNLICAGHYFTETFGVRLVAEKLSREHGIQTEFLDVPTGL